MDTTLDHEDVGHTLGTARRGAGWNLKLGEVWGADLHTSPRLPISVLLFEG